MPFLPLDPGWVKSQDPDPGLKTQIIFQRAWKLFSWVKIFKFFDANPGWKKFGPEIWDPGWKKLGSGIRNKPPGSVTLLRAPLVPTKP